MNRHRRPARIIALLAAALTAATAPAAPPADGRDALAARARIAAAAADLARREDTFAAVAYLHARADAREVVALYSLLAGRLYWKDRDLPRASAVLRAGILHCLAEARRAQGADAASARRFRAAAARMAYNLGSFTWPGWAEKGIAVTATDRAVGYDAARCCLRLTTAGGGDEKALANAHWLVGAWRLARKEYDAAAESFRRARAHAAAGKDAAGELMARGYLAVTDILAGRDAPGGRRRLAAIVAELRRLGSEDAKVYAPQFAMVLKALGG